MASKKFYLVLTDSGEYAFYPKTKKGLIEIASLYNNTESFYEVTVNKKVLLEYDAKEVPTDFTEELIPGYIKF